ncbi:hypothetical protein Trco_005239 [Trichoderma cornu-damae]|uniref:F-box domain-containing protein n=1 Tax=Trichoderma cornu-damae TaxID=654480 RepID=A0A9P8QH19_9HYPO|nr:hypothetical protein Trco_005239 [Trichoderma cornu-damae]
MRLRTRQCCKQGFSRDKPPIHPFCRDDGEETQLNSSCLLLNIPTEIFLLIAKYLPRHQQSILSQTCYPLRRLLLDSDGACNDISRTLLPGKLDEEQRLDFLFCLARSRPGSWVCDICVKLHRVDLHDVPARPRPTRCYRSLVSNCSYYRHGYDMHHRHFQLMLKYTRLLEMEDNSEIRRLRSKYRKHLNRLMEPFSEPLHSFRYGMYGQMKGSYCAYPKVVDGRLLIHATWTYHNDPEDVAHATSMGTLCLCLHQAMVPNLPWVLCRLTPIARSDDDLLMAQTRCNPSRVLEFTILEAFLAVGKETRGFCPFCETDFSVQVSPKIATVRAWHNLGSEVTISSNDPWKWQTNRHSRDGVYAQPGSVRRLYCQAGSAQNYAP